MNIKITGRRIEMSSTLKEYARKKVKKVEKYFHQLIDAHIILDIDKLDHTAEAIINGDGVQFYGLEKSEDMYSSIDLLISKMEKQVIKYKEKDRYPDRQGKRGDVTGGDRNPQQADCN